MQSSIYLRRGLGLKTTSCSIAPVAVRERTTCLRGGVRAAPGSGGSSPVGIGRRGVTPYGEMTPCEMTSGAPVISGGSSGGTSAMGRTTVAPATSAVSPVRKRCWRGGRGLGIGNWRHCCGGETDDTEGCGGDAVGGDGARPDGDDARDGAVASLSIVCVGELAREYICECVSNTW